MTVSMAVYAEQVDAVMAHAVDVWRLNHMSLLCWPVYALLTMSPVSPRKLSGREGTTIGWALESPQVSPGAHWSSSVTSTSTMTPPL